MCTHILFPIGAETVDHLRSYNLFYVLSDINMLSYFVSFHFKQCLSYFTDDPALSFNSDILPCLTFASCQPILLAPWQSLSICLRAISTCSMAAYLYLLSGNLSLLAPWQPVSTCSMATYLYLLSGNLSLLAPWQPICTCSLATYLFMLSGNLSLLAPWQPISAYSLETCLYLLPGSLSLLAPWQPIYTCSLATYLYWPRIYVYCA